MPLHPQARITVELTSTRPTPFDPEWDSLSEMDELGSAFIEAELSNLFGKSLDSITVTATHSLVEPAAA